MMRYTLFRMMIGLLLVEMHPVLICTKLVFLLLSVYCVLSRDGEAEAQRGF